MTAMAIDKCEIKARIQAKEANPSAEALARRGRSIARLKQEGVPTIDHLPVIDDSQSARTRTTEELARRAIALCIVALKGEGLEPEDVRNLVADYGAREFFSADELEFIEAPAVSELARIQFCWRYECLWVMLWALGYIESLGYPDTVCDVPKSVGILYDHSTESLVSAARLRSLPEILDETDLMYRYNWAAVDARVRKVEAPAGLDGGITKERHHALNWLIGYMNQEWDDVTTDT